MKTSSKFYQLVLGAAVGIGISLDREFPRN